LFGDRAVVNCQTTEDPELDYLNTIARGVIPKA
jgi:hypothetical protein